MFANEQTAAMNTSNLEPSIKANAMANRFLPCSISLLPLSGHYRMTLDAARAANCVGHKPGNLNK
jgi:hypothetical protein